MKIVLKKILLNLHRYVLWALISVVLWAWLFTLSTSTVRAKKVTVYCDVPSLDEAGITIELEKELPEGIRMIKVSSFKSLSNSVIDLDEADIYILPEEKALAALEFIQPIREAGPDDGNELVSEGQVFGLLFRGSAGGFIEFGEGSYYLCFVKSSPHLGGLNGSKDDAAVTIAERILAMP